MKFIKYIIYIVIAFVIIYFGIYFYAWINPKLNLNKDSSYYIYDKNGELINKDSDWISLSDISPHLINATISIEDKNYYNHIGFDYLRIGKSMYNNFKSKSLNEGASTITQQYAKNLFLEFDKKWSRKIKEAWLTIRLEVHYSKDEILEGYLNTINYGGIFGIENASKYYFNKSAKDLTLSEASLLAGIPKWPNKYSPFVDLVASKERQKNILKAMVKNKYISQTEMDDAYNTDLVFADINENNSLKTTNYYLDAVLNELKELKINFLITSGLRIYTNFDFKAQNAIENAINKYVNNDIQVASSIIEPNTGKVLALVGGVDYSKSQYNRAINANRGVGSSIKSFLYYSALENGFTSSSTFTSEKTSFVFGDNEIYSPSNYSDTYPNKEISLATAIACSDNIFAVKTHLFLGEDTLVNTLKRVGITSKLDSLPSLALGSQPISVLEMTSAYSTLANEGYKIKPYFIEKIEDVNGNVIYEYDEIKEAVLNKNITFILSELLKNTSNPVFIDYSYPTAYIMAKFFTKTYAIKTGTTDYDHLVFGYNKDAVLGIWSGYDDNREIVDMDIYNNKMMWVNIMEEYLSDREDNWYSLPNNVVGVLIDPLTGKQANDDSTKKIIAYYIKGTEPFSNYSLDDVIPTIKEIE